MHFFHRYIDQPSSPLYPFGHGLSYTEFKYSNLALSGESLGTGGQLTVSVDVTNSGNLAGDEVVQLYITDLVASRTRPVKELKGFERESLEPGQTRTVTFSLTPEDLAFFSGAGRHEAEKGEFKVWVGPSSEDKALLTKKFNLI